MVTYNFVLDSNIFIHLFEAGVNYSDFFEIVHAGFNTQGINSVFWSGNFAVSDIPRRFHDIKNQVKKIINTGGVRVLNVDRETETWNIIAERAQRGNGFQPFINPINDPYDIDCLYMQYELKQDSRTVILTSDSGIEKYTNSCKEQSLDIVGLSCATRVLLGDEHEGTKLLDKLVKDSIQKQESYLLSQQRMHVLAKRRQEALKFVTDVASRFRGGMRPIKRRRIVPSSNKTPIFNNVIEAVDCTKYDPIVASTRADCFLCFNQRLSHICPNLEEFPSLLKEKISTG